MAVDRNKLIQEGEKLVRQGKIDKAIACFEQALEASPKDINLKNKIGDLYLKVGDNANATRIFSEIGAFYADEGFYLKSIAMYKKVNKTNPSAIDVYLKLADLYVKQGLNNDARSQYQQVADLYLKDGNTARAVEAITLLLKIDADNIKVRVRLAELEAKSGRGAQAIAQYLEVGALLQNKGMYEEAVRAAYEPGVALDESNVSLAAGLLKSLFEIGKFEELLSRGRALFAKHRESVPFLATMAEAYSRSGQPDMARTAFEKLAALEPENPAWRERLGDVKAGKRPAAAAPAPGGGMLPDLSEMSGDYSMAELEEVSGEWAATADLTPDVVPNEGEGAGPVDSEKDEFILEHMTEAEVFIKYGLIEKAIDNLEAIVNHYPDEAESLRRLKDLHLEAGNKGKAAEKCVDLARIARSKGDVAKAMELLAEARAHDPGVKVDRPASAPQAPAASAGEVAYDFGGAETAGVALDFEGGPPSSGVELEFDMPGGAGDSSAKRPAAAASYEPPANNDLDFSEPAAADGIDFTIDEASPGDEGGIEIEVDEGESAAAEPEDGELAEADFYAEQGFAAEASKRLDALSRRFPRSRKVRERIDRLQRAAQGRDEEAPVETPAGDDGIEFFDNAIRAPKRDAVVDASSDAPFASDSPLGVEEADDSLFEQESAFLSGAEAAPGAAPAPAGASSGVGEESLEEIFKEFKDKDEQQVPTEDYATHYDLGMAYLETGLFDDAISEFQMAAKDPSKFIGCCTNLGMCFREKGMPKLAVKWYSKALERLDAEQESPEYIAIMYELGCAYELAGEKEQALEAFTNVLGLDASYRDVSDKVDQLSQ